MLRLVQGLALAAAAMTALAPAAEAAGAIELTRFFGHKVEIGDDGDGMQALKLDDKALVTDGMVFLESADVVDGVPILRGTSSCGGNACPSSTFIIVFPKDAAPRFDASEEVPGFKVETGAAAIHFEDYADPVDGRQDWSWTPAGGFRKEAFIPFAVDPAKGWDAIEAHKLDDPAAIFGNGGVGASIARLFDSDADRKTFTERLSHGPFSQDYLGRDYTAQACIAHDCPSGGAMLYLAGADRSAYAAWKLPGEKIVVRPPVKTWPKPARAKLKDWAAQFP
jgi:hypothetical protein